MQTAKNWKNNNFLTKIERISKCLWSTYFNHFFTIPKQNIWWYWLDLFLLLSFKAIHFLKCKVVNRYALWKMGYVELKSDFQTTYCHTLSNMILRNRSKEDKHLQSCSPSNSKDDCSVWILNLGLFVDGSICCYGRTFQPMKQK